MSEKKAEKIEFEQVTIKVPRLVLDFLRKTEDDAVEWIEYTVVDNVRAEIEGMTWEEWASLFNLEPVFDAVLKKEKDVEEPGCFVKVDFAKKEFLERIDKMVERRHYRDRDQFIRSAVRRELVTLEKQ
jgi:hypothetical protein